MALESCVSAQETPSATSRRAEGLPNRETMKLITLSRNQYLLIFMTLCIGVSALVAGGADRAIYALCAESFWGVPYQEHLGFKTGWLRDPSGQPKCWGVTEVVEEGVFAN